LIGLAFADLSPQFRVSHIEVNIVGVDRPRNEGEAMSELWGIARVKFHEGKVEEFKRLSAQLMEIARTKDTGTLQYEIYLNDDESEGIVLERY
jgi:hypothetical protein